MLSIGSGNGRYDIPLMEHLAMAVDFIEPSAVLRQQLIQNLERHNGPGRAGVVFGGPFEQFSAGKKYDLIFASHSFYFVKDPVESVRAARKLLKPGGHLVIVLAMSHNLGITLSRALGNYMHGEVTADWLQKQIDIPSELKVIDSVMPYEMSVGGDELTPRAQVITQFYANKNWADLTPEERQRARDVIDSFSDGRTVRDKTGFLIIRAEETGLPGGI
jgi:SAM-dependent methyltransferase